MLRKISIGAISLVLVLLVAATVYIVGAKPRPIQAHDGVKLTPLRTISTVEARVLLFLTRVQGISVRNATDLYRMFLTHAMATHNSSSPEFKRLLRIAGIIEQNLKNNLDAETAKLCWFGDEGDTVVSELEQHSFG